MSLSPLLLISISYISTFHLNLLELSKRRNKPFLRHLYSMAPPAENNAHCTGGDSQRSIPTPFLTKTYQLVDDHTIDDVISWNDTGSSFIVWNTTAFAKDLLPKYFKHNNYSSFVRQLNTYGFRKVVPDRWEFFHEYFRRGEKRLLCEIQRRKILPVPTSLEATATVAVPQHAIPTAKPIVSPSNSGEEQVISSYSSLSRAPADLLDENEILRKENIMLTNELEEMRSLCNNIFNLMSNYAKAQVDGAGSSAAKTLCLMPGKLCSGDDAAEMNTKLFGLSVGTKRAREDGRGAEYDTALSLNLPFHAVVKNEQLAFGRQGQNRKTQWLNQCPVSNQKVSN